MTFHDLRAWAPRPTARHDGSDMRILDAKVTQARRDGAMGRIEARVELLLQRGGGAAPERRVMQASVPDRDPKGRPARVRLVADAVRMAALMPAGGAHIRHAA